MLKTLASPFFLATLLLVFGEGCLFSAWKRLGKRERLAVAVSGFGLLVLLLPSLPIVTLFLANQLERQYFPPSEQILRQLDVVVVLSGGYYQGADAEHDVLSPETAARVACGIRAFSRSGARRLVMSGTSSARGNTRDGSLMKGLALSLGMSSEQILIEPYSQSTFEHPRELAMLKEIHATDRIGVATSSWHLPRAVREFRRRFVDVTPIPCGSLEKALGERKGSFIPEVRMLSLSTVLIQEFLGMVWYQLRSMTT